MLVVSRRHQRVLQLPVIELAIAAAVLAAAVLRAPSLSAWLFVAGACALVAFDLRSVRRDGEWLVVRGITGAHRVRAARSDFGYRVTGTRSPGIQVYLSDGDRVLTVTSHLALGTSRAERSVARLREALLADGAASSPGARQAARDRAQIAQASETVAAYYRSPAWTRSTRVVLVAVLAIITLGVVLTLATGR